ncbi:hypothetical protein ACEP28_04975 [Pseudomonas aeruginosa]|nr:hypothetical protein [Pseudomonas aeruginosa]
MRPTFSTDRSKSALKAAASKLRKETPSLSQTEALNMAAASAGFANYAHAQRTLPEVMPALELRCRWREGAAGGVELLKYPLPWSAMDIAAMKLKAARVATFEPLQDGLYCSNIASSRYMARYWLVQALRELMLMEVTGLRPDYISKRLPKTRQEFSGIRYSEPVSPPGSDHLSAWFSPDTNATLLLDEPYLDRDKPHDRAAERAQWCKRFGFQEMASAWGGTHLPPKTRPFLLARPGSGIDLAEIEAKLNLLPDDFGSHDDDWRGSSEPGSPASRQTMNRSLDQLVTAGYLDEHSGVDPNGVITATRLQP